MQIYIYIYKVTQNKPSPVLSLPDNIPQTRGAQNRHTATRTTSPHRQQQQYSRGTTRPGYHTAHSTAIHKHTYIVYTPRVRLDDEI